MEVVGRVNLRLALLSYIAQFFKKTRPTTLLPHPYFYI